MSFSSEWDARYQENTHLSVWPWSDLVSYTYRYAKPFKSNTKVLEIGFGAGANIPFFLALGVDYYGIEGSASVVERVLEGYPELQGKLKTGDFIHHAYTDLYDLVVDRGSMTHNDTNAISAGLKKLSAAMNPGGKYIGIDWFSVEHSDFSLGDVADAFTRENIVNGQFSGVGKVHFSSKTHLIELFSEAGMRVTRLEHKVTREEVPNTGHVFAAWNLVAEKN